MKVLSTHLATLINQKESRQNLLALGRFFLLLVTVITVYSVLFHVIMLVEGRRFSWLTGLYWTMTVMSTLGFGDITFQSDIGRVFSLIVLLSGILLLLIMMPFLFIRLFYAPWLESHLRVRAPRAAPEDVRDHVIICTMDATTPGLMLKLRRHGIPFYAIEADAERAARMHLDGIPVVQGFFDDRPTYEALHADRARLVVANSDDPNNTNITLTVRSTAPKTPIVAMANRMDSVDILRLSGADFVLPLKERLGEQLANRVNTNKAMAHVIGNYRDQLIAEFPVQGTPFVGRAIRDARLREISGVSIIGVWEGGHLNPAHPDTVLTDMSVPVVIGTAAQIDELNIMLVIYSGPEEPVIVVGGGTVGQAATRALRQQGVRVNMIESNPTPGLEEVPDRLIVGDAAELHVLMEAGLEPAPTVLLTTHDDAINIFLAVYCRRLQPDLRIVSRVTYERNIEAVLRAGANFVLSEAWLGAEIIMAQVMHREMIILGEGLELLSIPLPPSLAGKTLAQSEIGARTGMNVIGIEEEGHIATNPSATTKLPLGGQLIALGSPAQRELFTRYFMAAANGKLKDAIKKGSPSVS